MWSPISLETWVYTDAGGLARVAAADDVAARYVAPDVITAVTVSGDLVACTSLDGTSALLHARTGLCHTVAAPVRHGGETVLANAPAADGAGQWQVSTAGYLRLQMGDMELEAVVAHRGAARVLATTGRDQGGRQTVFTAGDDGRVGVFRLDAATASIVQIGAYPCRGACTALAVDGSTVVVGDALGHLAVLLQHA
jgi:hypothetical protein